MNADTRRFCHCCREQSSSRAVHVLHECGHEHLVIFGVLQLTFPHTLLCQSEEGSACPSDIYEYRKGHGLSCSHGDLVSMKQAHGKLKAIRGLELETCLFDRIPRCRSHWAHQSPLVGAVEWYDPRNCSGYFLGSMAAAMNMSMAGVMDPPAIGRMRTCSRSVPVAWRCRPNLPIFPD